MTTTADVVVIGGGIAGLSAAWALARDLSVVVLEQEQQLASHATGRSAAVVSETYGPPTLCALAHASRAFLTAPPDDFGSVALVAPRGMLWVSDRPDSLNEIVARASALGVAHERLSPREAVGVVGALRLDWVRDALIEPDAMSIDVAALVEGYRSELIRRGGRILTNHHAVGLEGSGGSWSVTHTNGTIRCGIVVNAAGSWVDQVAAAAGLTPLGFLPLRRTAFVFPDHHHVTAGWPLVMDHGGRFYFEPEGNAILASPADETLCEPHDARADDIAMAKATDALSAATFLEVRGVRSRWAGLRTFAPDRRPVIGFDPRADGFFWLAGQGGGGIKTSPAMATLTHALITGSDLDPLLSAIGVSLDDLAPERLIV